MFSRGNICTSSTKSYISSLTLKECAANYPSSPTLSTPVWVWEGVQPDTLKRFLASLDQILTSGSMPTTIQLQLLPAVIAIVLTRLVNKGIDERTVLTHFLHHLADSAAGDRLSRRAKLVIATAYKDLSVDGKDAKTIEVSLRIQYSEADSEVRYDIPTFQRRSG